MRIDRTVPIYSMPQHSSKPRRAILASTVKKVPIPVGTLLLCVHLGAVPAHGPEPLVKTIWEGDDYPIPLSSVVWLEDAYEEPKPKEPAFNIILRGITEPYGGQSFKSLGEAVRYAEDNIRNSDFHIEETHIRYTSKSEARVRRNIPQYRAGWKYVAHIPGEPDGGYWTKDTARAGNIKIGADKNTHIVWEHTKGTFFGDRKIGGITITEYEVMDMLRLRPQQITKFTKEK